MSDVLPAGLRAAAALGGEMGQRFLNFDWAGHPLGDPAGWPTAIQSQVATALASRFPIVLWLGEPLYLVYNDAYIPVLTDKHPAALAKPGAEVWWDIWDVIGPMLASVMATGVATWSDDLMLMLVVEGRREERYFTFTYSPILTDEKQPAGVFCAVNETTERVLGERRLQALNALAAALLDISSADAVLAAAIEVCAAHDADLPFAAVYRTDGPPGQGWPQRVTPGAAGLLPPSLAPLLDGATRGTDDAWLVDGLPSRLPGLAERLGGRCPEQALVIEISGPAGAEPGAVLVFGLNCRRPLDEQYRGFCGLLADQVAAALAAARAYEDERRRAEVLAELDAAKTAFLANVSHEFRTPLTLMLGPLEELIAAHAGAGDAEAEQLEMIRRNGRRLARLVNSLLDFSRIEAGRARPKLAVTDVGALTAGLASLFADVCRLAGISLVTECEAAWARVDPEMWETIVLNLVSNAVKYTLTGSVTVRAGPARDGGIEMTVTDTGTGIAAADLPHLFERFYRTQNAAGRSAEGSGIGLALVKSLIEIHDGSVVIDSVPGAGTSVRVRLPAAAVAAPDPVAGVTAPLSGTAGAYVDEAMQWAAEAGDRPARAGEPAGDRGDDRALVLVADDNADMRAHLARVLGARWNVITAADGAGALELARSHRPDLLVTDVMMPAMDGFGLVAAVQADPALALLPVIMLSARAGVEAVGEGLAAGVGDYLVKPFAAADLVNRVAARLEAANRDQSRHGLPGRREQALTRLGSALGEARSVEQALEALLAAPLCCLEATGADIGIVDEPRGVLRISCAEDMQTEATDRYRLVELEAPVPMADVVRTGETMVITDTARPSPRYSHIAPGTGARIVHPLRDGEGTVIGVVGLSWPRPRSFTPAEVEITRRAAAILARAMVRISAAEREHQIAVALQEHLLDLGTGTKATVTAAVYQPAGQALRVGGDWYTATPVGAGRTGVSAGDVSGHGLPAAAVMSQLRSALAAAVLADPEPAAVLGLLDRFARINSGAMFATAAYAVIDTHRGTLDYSCAGHPYPLVITPGGEVTYLRDGRRAPLGARSAIIEPAVGHAAFPAGSLLLLYTDGLIERRRESIDAGLARLAEAAAGCAALPAGAVCAALLEAMAGPDGYEDDVALIAVRPCGTTASSHVDAVPAAFTEMAPARRRLADWLESLVQDRVQVGKILLCAGEALSNAIEHGSDRDADRTVAIEAFAAANRISVTVSDSGSQWAKGTVNSRSAGRGRGLTLIHGLADHVQITRTLRGTRVTVTFRLDRPHP